MYCRRLNEFKNCEDQMQQPQFLQRKNIHESASIKIQSIEYLCGPQSFVGGKCELRHILKIA